MLETVRMSANELGVESANHTKLLYDYIKEQTTPYTDN